MAGGKETPRQKMIGMMYLVLTALLALQVSSAIIQKFIQLDNSLMNLNRQTTEENVAVINRIKKTVADEGNKDKAVVDRADLVHKKTEEILSKINKLREEMIVATGGYDVEEGHKTYKGAKEEEKVAIMMLGPTKQGKAYPLKKDLNEYASFLKQAGQNMRDPNNKVEVPGQIAFDGKDHPLFKNDPDQRNKDFGELNFANTPLVAALAVMAQQESEILKYEGEILAALAKEVGAADLKFDQVTAMVRPTSKVVAAGTKYEAELFLTASASSITPTMTCEGRDLVVDASTKRGKVQFTVTPGAYDKDGNAKKKWKGAIKFNFRGKDTIFPVEEEYIVARPVIQVQSASVNALYKNCGNELNVQVPALGSTYSPSFRADGASVIAGGQKGIVTVIPTGAKVNLYVSSNGNAIGSQEFKVRLIPKPTIECLAGRTPVNEKTGVPAPGPRSLQMKAVPDESFAAFLPKDARYKVSEWDCILVRGKRPVATNNFKTEVGNLSNFASAAQPGDRILIEVKKVTRTNFLNKVEEVNLGTVIKNIPLH
ncbi:MAG: gliding motility protein GldM [Cytophagaceae bacterium]|nr:gliding motility protein GldM [Cytophagaceae bacterium]